jgi:hypothetical protein
VHYSLVQNRGFQPQIIGDLRADRHIGQLPGASSHSKMMVSAPFSLHEEIRLYTTNASHKKYNLLTTLFGIVVVLDYLERVYVRDSITVYSYLLCN